MSAAVDGAVDLYWLPLGAGGHVVRRCGRAYECLAARRAGRRPLDLYHAALEVTVTGGRFAIELTPVPRGGTGGRGVVGEGAVGSPLLRPLRIFRYELHARPDGAIPDLAAAVESPRQLGRTEADARLLLARLPTVPLLTWGRDELGLGEMWNSNSVIAWLLARADLDLSPIDPPRHGRAPGWRAGLTAARAGRAELVAR
ncbi:MAG TPA: hypothetical protein VMF55_06325 [Solirubrobacterales bacterium]|nr:hypothetical protein [Solirubrobacterales bacterium]